MEPPDRPARPELPDVSFDWSEADWEKLGRTTLDLAAELSTGWAERRPGTEAAPADIRARFRGPAPSSPVPWEDILGSVRDAASMSNFIGHPGWYGYITSSPSPVGVMGDLVTSALNPNIGLWRGGPAATTIELQAIEWIKELLGYPPEAEGVFTSGGQLASILAHNVIRDQKAGWDVRHHGVRGPDGSAPPMRIYVSEELHYCHQQAVELLGMGRDAARLVPTDDQYRMRVDACADMIREDRERGDIPLAIVGTAGTVGTGAVDPLPELHALSRREGLWFHVDGAYGAFAVITPSAPASLRAMSEADSIACDPHKWLFAPIDAGVTLIRTPGLLLESFAFHASYLHHGNEEVERVDFAEVAPENSRRARGIKVWMALQAYGADGYRDMIERNIRLSAYMEALVEATPGLRRAAPRDLSIVCWRVEPPGVASDALDLLQTRVMEELERRGVAIVSTASLKDGTTALRACIVNFRTGPEDVERTVQASADIASELAHAER